MLVSCGRRWNNYWRKNRQPNNIHSWMDVPCSGETMKKKSSFFLLLAIACDLSGCADVQPWERGNLAKPHMALDPDPTTSAMRMHAYVSREAASGGDSADGGGCGCN